MLSFAECWKELNGGPDELKLASAEVRRFIDRNVQAPIYRSVARSLASEVARQLVEDGDDFLH